MLIERKTIDKAAILRGLRAIAGIDQRQAAAQAGISLRTVTNAESGQCGRATYDKLTALYAAYGARLVAMPSLSGECVPMIALDPANCQLGQLIGGKARQKK